MKRTSERGVALVITLIMLSLVTFMAVVFLGISRRERASVTVTGDIITARLMTDAALARAESEIASRLLTSTNLFDYDLIVSTNYYNPAGFQPNNTNVANVNYELRANGGSMLNGSASEWAQNIANLLYDPRPPVFIPSSQTGLRTNDFRFYLDLNRNRMFEPTGLLTNVNSSGPGSTVNQYVGDPQWIGVLERPDRPHSESNRFVGRYAYVVLPAGKSLDVNFMHNNAKAVRNDGSMDGFLRHQGVGSWEINLAGFLAALNTNINAWPVNLAYNYVAIPGSPNFGFAFEDSARILSHRYERDRLRLASVNALFNFPPNNPFTTNGVDYYSDGPLTSYLPNPVNAPWSGSYNPNGYYDIQELFNTNKTSLGFVSRLTSRSTNVNASAYDRYTFYRLLAQMGTDSAVPESNRVYFSDYRLHPTNRMHLLYQNPFPNAQTNFVPWTALAFFTNAADRVLRASVEPIVLTNGLVRDTNFMLGLTPVRNAFCATNIQLQHSEAGRGTLPFYMTNNEYSSATHRLLQLSANIHDATTVRRMGTTNDYPTVYRPVFMRTSTNLIIRGFIEENGAEFLNNPWTTVDQAAVTWAQGTVISNINLHGVPLVIGAKKGYPNFNKFVLQTVAEVSRRLEIRKATASGMPVATNQMYSIGISNRFGIEGWNSYQRDFERNVELRVTGQSSFALHHRAEGAGINFLPVVTNLFVSNTIPMTRWAGSTNQGGQSSFIIAVNTNMTTLPSSAYLTRTGALLPVTAGDIFENSFRVPQWLVRMTNRLQYVLIDRGARDPYTGTPRPRIIDYVSLDKLVTDVDLSRGLTGDTNAAGGGVFSDKNRGGAVGGASPLADGDMWNPERLAASLDTPPMGVLNQISVAQGSPYIGEGTWRSSSAQLGDKEAAIRQFTEFMSGRLTNLVWQVPFTPSRRLYQRTSWEANDPLVHYMAEDLTEPVIPGTTNLVCRPIPFFFPVEKDALIGEMNPRYRPWGGNPRKSPDNDMTAYALTMKDPLVRSSDDWQFPTNQMPNLGWLGRVHRGTPWQTMYLKAAIDPRNGQAVDLQSWSQWSGSYGTHPTNDWKLLDLFTVALNDNASRGLLSVNQTNLASWSAVLSGVTVYTNAAPDAAAGPGRPPVYNDLFIQPNSPQMLYMVDGINRARAQQTNRVFRTMGDVLATPELTVYSPFLNLTKRQYEQGVGDAAYERIPQQILSLLRTDEPRVVVYAFGQSLRPAERSLVTVANMNPPIFNLCTNYQVTGEYAAKAVVRLEESAFQPLGPGAPWPAAQKMRAIVENYTVLQSD